LETVREYALERLEASGEGDAVRRAHAGRLWALAKAALPHYEGSQLSAWLHRVEADYDNLRAALAWTWERGEAETHVRLAGPAGRGAPVAGAGADAARRRAARRAHGGADRGVGARPLAGRRRGGRRPRRRAPRAFARGRGRLRHLLGALYARVAG